MHKSNIYILKIFYIYKVEKNGREMKFRPWIQTIFSVSCVSQYDIFFMNWHVVLPMTIPVRGAKIRRVWRMRIKKGVILRTELKLLPKKCTGFCRIYEVAKSRLWRFALRGKGSLKSLMKSKTVQVLVFFQSLIESMPVATETEIVHNREKAK